MGNLEALVQTYGYWAVFVGTVLEGETVLVLGGFAAYSGYLELPWVILAAFVGALSGDGFCFYLGRWHARGTLARYPSWTARIERAKRLLERYHKPLLLAFRFFYGLRSVIPFAIGLSRVPAGQFVVLNAVGAAGWAVLVGTGGYLFGGALGVLIEDVQHYELMAMIVVAIVGTAIWIAYFYRKRVRRLRALREKTGAGQSVEGPIAELAPASPTLTVKTTSKSPSTP